MYARLLFISAFVAIVLLAAVNMQAQTLECRAEVRTAMVRAWESTDNGASPFEAAFLVLQDGSITNLGNSHEYLSQHLGAIPDGAIIFHTHPVRGVAKLSKADKQVADMHGTFIYAITVRGLYQYSHATGERIVRPNTDWSKPCGNASSN